MSEPTKPRIPRKYRGTDLQSAYLDGHEDATAGRPLVYKNMVNLCAAEITAYTHGHADAWGKGGTS